MRSIRQALQSATVRYGADKKTEVQRTSDVHAKANRVQGALEKYTTALSGLHDASRALFAELHGFYPPSGQLAGTLQYLASADGSAALASPWDATATASRCEQLKMYLSQPAAGLAAVADGIADDIKRRDTLHAEVQHYTDKVGRLQQEFNAAKPSAREDARQRLEDNKTKLSAAMEQYSATLHKVEAAMGSLDADIVAVLTPTVMQLLKAQMRIHSDTVQHYHAGLERAGATAPPLPPPAPPTASGPAASGGTAGGASGALDFGAVKLKPSAAATSATTTAAGAAGAAPAVVGAAGAASADAAAVDRSGFVVVRAVAPYDPAADGDVGFATGDVMLVTQRTPDGWWACRNDQEMGVAPSNYLVEVADPAPTGTGTLLYAYTSDDPTELKLAQGDKVDVLTDVAAHEGTGGEKPTWLLVRKAGQGIGYVPANYVTVGPVGGGAAAAKVAKPVAPAVAAPAAAAAPSAAKAAPTAGKVPPIAAGAAAAAAALAARGASDGGSLSGRSVDKDASSARSDTSGKAAASAPAVPKPGPPAAAAPAPPAAKPKPPAPAAAAPAAGGAGSPRAPPDGHPFWSDPAMAAYAKLLRMGMPVEHVTMKMDREGVDTAAFNAAAPAASATPAPAVAAAAAVAAKAGGGASKAAPVAPAPPIPIRASPAAPAVVSSVPAPSSTTASPAAAAAAVAAAKPAAAASGGAGTKSGGGLFSRLGFGGGASVKEEAAPVAAAAPVPAVPKPAAAKAAAPKAPAPPKGVVKSSAASDDDAGGSQPGALLAGIQGFNKKGLKKAVTVEKGGVGGPPAGGAAGATGAAGKRPASGGSAAAAAPAAVRTSTPSAGASGGGGGGMSLMDQIQKRALARKAGDA